MVIVTSLSTNKLDHESDLQFFKRLCDIKSDIGITWKELANIVEAECGVRHSESWYRRNYNAGAFDESLVGTVTTSSSDVQDTEQENVEDNKLQQLLMKRAEVCDLVSSNNAMIRRMSREQTIRDIAHDFANTMSTSKQLITLKNIPNETTGVEGILLISDWHYGMTCDNWWNKFDPEICKERVGTLLTTVIKNIKQNRLQKLTVLDLSDLIAGRIHSQIRIESRFDVITQTMEVSEILAEFLSELSLYCPIDFYSCLDNHSRLEPNKKESMDLESLTRIIPWYLKERLHKNARINICSNDVGEDIITCEVLGHPVIAVHGHDDSPINAIEKLSMLTHKHYDLVCMAHRHHMFLEEQFESIVISNGCLVGVDSHSQKMRLTSKPSQTMIIVTADNVIESVKRILL